MESLNYKENLVKPLLFMVFNRPEKTKLVWEQIRKAKPQKLYISADGPREDHPEDKEKCEQVREIIRNMDWECSVKTLFHAKNIGCTLAGKSAFDWVFGQEVEMIQMEDDVLPTQSFFWFVQEMLEKYKEDKRIAFICTENYGIKSGDATYFFTQFGYSGGWATWKRVYDLYEYKLESLEEVVNTPKFKKSFLTSFQYDYWKLKFFQWKYIGGNTYDLQNVYLIHKFNMINILPNINLNTNIGWDSEATNSSIKNIEDPLALKWGNKPSFEIEEIIHPPDVISSDPEIGIQWFSYQFLGNESEFEHRLRSMLHKIVNLLKWPVRPIYRSLFKTK
jgi:hypothetical protein